MRHFGPLALFGALAIAWTWPLAGHLHAAVPGDPGDNYSFLWNLWWMRHTIATPGLAYFHTTYLFHPFGTTIANHPHTALPAIVAATLLGRASIVRLWAMSSVRSSILTRSSWLTSMRAGSKAKRCARTLNGLAVGAWS